MRQLKRPSTHTIWRLGIQTQASQYMTGDKTSRSVKVKPLKFFADYMCLQYYRNVFTGIEAAEWFMGNMQGVHTLDMAQNIGQKFLELNVFKSVNVCTEFVNRDIDSLTG